MPLAMQGSADITPFRMAGAPRPKIENNNGFYRFDVVPNWFGSMAAARTACVMLILLDIVVRDDSIAENSP